MNIDSNDIYCPITHQIFLDPVIAADGFTYEKDALEEWYKRNASSPMLGTKVNTTLYVQNIIVRNMVKYILNNNSELQEEQYKIIETFKGIIKKIKTKTLKIENTGEIEGYEECERDGISIFMKDNNVYELTKKIRASEYLKMNGKYRLIDLYMKYCKNEEAIKHVLEKTQIDETNGGLTTLYYASLHQSLNIIRMILEKNNRLNIFETVKRKNAFYNICGRKNMYETIEYMLSINNNSELLKMNDIYMEKMYKYVHAACNQGNPETMELLVKKGLDIEAKTGDGVTCFIIACKNKNIELIKYFLNKKVNLVYEEKMNEIFINSILKLSKDNFNIYKGIMTEYVNQLNSVVTK